MTGRECHHEFFVSGLDTGIAIVHRRRRLHQPRSYFRVARDSTWNQAMRISVGRYQITSPSLRFSVLPELVVRHADPKQ